MRYEQLQKMAIAALSSIGMIMLIVSTAQAGSLLDEMQVQDTCGATYADKLASCTPFRCEKPSPMAMGLPSREALVKMPPERQKEVRDLMAAAEKRLQAMSAEKRAAMKAGMTSVLEIRGFDKQGRCRTTTAAMPGYKMDCSLDKTMLNKLVAYTRLAANAERIQIKNELHIENGKRVTTQTDTIDGKSMPNPWTEAQDQGQCRMLEKTAADGWVSMDQINRMSHVDIKLSEHGKPVDGHIRILNAADGKVLFDKDVKTSQRKRQINLKPGTFDIKVTSKNPQLAPVWFRGVNLGAANVFRKNIEFYAISGTLKLTVTVNGVLSKGAAIYVKDPDTRKWLGRWTAREKPTFTFSPASIELPETLTGRYQVFVAAVPKGLSVPEHATYKDFLLTIKNNETVEKTISFGETIVNAQQGSMAAGETLSHLVPLQLYWSGKNQDNFVTATRKGADEALAAGYRFARTEACVTAADTKLAERSPGSRELKLFWSQNRGDHFSSASSRGEHDARAAGYQFVRTEGYILPIEKPGTVPLKLYWSSNRKDNFTTATSQGAHDAEAAGYRFARIQGYVYPASKCQGKSLPLPEDTIGVVAGKFNKSSISGNAGHSANPRAPATPAKATPRQEQKTEKNVNTLFILDASGSMWGQVNGKPKITIAKDVMTKLVPELPDASQIGLIAYGHRRKGDCNDVETLVKLGGHHQKAVLNAVKGLNAKGKTPLTKSVDQAMNMLRAEENTSTVVLVSDGIESCGGDPCAAVKAAKESGVNFTLHTVGFGLTRKESAQLQCMARAGGGEYFQANNAEELLQSARKAVQPTGVLRLAVKVNGKESDLMYRVEDASTGKIIRQPVLPTSSGLAIRLPNGEYNVFVLPAGVGGAGEQKLSLRMKAGEVIKKTLVFGKGVLHLIVTVNGKPAHAHIHIEDSKTHEGVYESSVFGFDTPININLAAGKVDIVVQAGGRDVPEKRVQGVEILAGKTTEQVIPVDVKSVASQVADNDGLEQDTDRPGGGDFRHIVPTSDDPALCQQACLNDAQCKAWTYVKPHTIQGDLPNCWLKTGVPPATHNTCCVSGVKLPSS